MVHAHATRQRAPGQRPSSQRCADTFHVPTRSDPQLAGSPVGANRPAETALCLESRARISLGARCPSEICRIRRFRSACTAGQYQDGLRRSDATDRSPLHSGAKPGTKGGSRRYQARYEARYTVAQGGTRQHVQVCCQAVCGAEAKHPCGRSLTSRGGGLQ